MPEHNLIERLEALADYLKLDSVKLLARRQSGYELIRETIQTLKELAAGQTTYEILDEPSFRDVPPTLDLFERLDVLRRRLPAHQAAILEEVKRVLAEGPTAAQEETADYIAQMAELEMLHQEALLSHDQKEAEIEALRSRVEDLEFALALAVQKGEASFQDDGWQPHKTIGDEPMPRLDDTLELRGRLRDCGAGYQFEITHTRPLPTPPEPGDE